MDQNPVLFTITCTTCQTKLAVYDRAAVGQIVVCPRCESMVEVTPPVGWSSAAEPVAGGDLKSTPVPQAAAADCEAAHAAAAAESGDTVVDVPPPGRPKPPPLPSLPSKAGPAAQPDQPAAPPVLSAPRRPVAMLGIAAVLLLAVAVSVWIFWGKRHVASPAAAVKAEPAPAKQVPPLPAATIERRPSLPAPLDRRWLPAQAKIIVQMQLSRIAAMPDRTGYRLTALADPIWGRTIAPLTTSLGLTLGSIRRLTWASTDLTAWHEPGVIMLELEPNNDARAIAAAGKATGLVLAGVVCRRLADTRWPYPLAALDEHTIITGREDQLRAVSPDAAAALESKPLARLSAAVPADPLIGVRIDLAAARAAKWPLPEAWLDLWPELAGAWRGAWSAADGLALTVTGNEKLRTQAVCSSADAAAAETVAAQLQKLRTAAISLLAAQLAAHAAKPGDADEAKAYSAFLQSVAAALQGAETKTAHEIVSLQADWDLPPSGVMTLALSSRDAMLVDWVTAVQSAAAKQKAAARQAKEPPNTSSPLPFGEGSGVRASSSSVVLGESGALAAASKPPAAPAPPTPPPPPAPDTEPEVDVSSRLAAEISAIEFQTMSLVDFIRFASELSGLPITLDLDALDRAGVKVQDSVDAKLTGTTVRGLLEAALRPRNLAVAVVHNHVLVTSPPGDRDVLRKVSYDVSDLTRADGTHLLTLLKEIQELVAPGTWKNAGGMGDMLVLGSSAVSVSQTGAVQAQILRFLERLRAARRLPSRSREPAERFPLTAACVRAEPILAKPVTFNFRPPRPLDRILPPLEEACQVSLVVNWAELAAAGVPARVKGFVTADKDPLGTTLDKLLGPLGLGYRAIDEQTLEITSRKVLADRLDLEFYPISDLLVGGRTAENLIKRLKQTVEKTAWAGSGGRGIVRFDEPSGHLLVLQSPPVQAAVARFLEGLKPK